MKISYKYTDVFINRFIAILLILQLICLFNFEANAMFRSLSRTFTVGEDAYRCLGTKFLTKKYAYSSKPNKSVPSDLNSELKALKKPHNPTGETYVEPKPNKVTLYPQWDLAVSERPLSGPSQFIDVVTGTQSIPNVGLMGTLKKKSQ